MGKCCCVVLAVGFYYILKAISVLGCSDPCSEHGSSAGRRAEARWSQLAMPHCKALSALCPMAWATTGPLNSRPAQLSSSACEEGPPPQGHGSPQPAHWGPGLGMSFSGCHHSVLSRKPFQSFEQCLLPIPCKDECHLIGFAAYSRVFKCKTIYRNERRSVYI